MHTGFLEYVYCFIVHESIDKLQNQVRHLYLKFCMFYMALGLKKNLSGIYQIGVLIATDEELDGAPTEGGDVASNSFPSFNELRFIEPVGP